MHQANAPATMMTGNAIDKIHNAKAANATTPAASAMTTPPIISLNESGNPVRGGVRKLPSRRMSSVGGV